MQLSERLSAVSSMITEGNRLADVGTDHAYIPIALCLQKKIPAAFAMDIGKGPLQSAQAHICRYGLEDRIITRLSDGVTGLAPGEADSVVIAGMGGALVQKILSEGAETLQSVQELILQPQSEVADVRRYLWENGYQITEEKMVLEDGKYYPMMRAVHGSMEAWEDIEWKYGRFLLLEKHPVLAEFLEKESRMLRKVENSLQMVSAKKAAERRIEIEALQRLNEKAKERMR